jgi:hypothetical protein
MTDRLASYRSALMSVGAIDQREMGLWLNNRAENSHQPFRRRERAMLRLRRMRRLQKRPSVHGSIDSHFNQKPTSPADWKTAAPPLSSSGASFAQPDESWGEGKADTLLICLTAQPNRARRVANFAAQRATKHLLFRWDHAGAIIQV